MTLADVLDGTIPKWWDAAECRTPEVQALIADLRVSFYPARGKSSRPAKRICNTCPVRAECLQYAMSIPGNNFGVWGGMTDRERRKLRAPQVSTIDHGTDAGYQRHHHRKEEACPACKAARARDKADRDTKRRKATAA